MPVTALGSDHLPMSKRRGARAIRSGSGVTGLSPQAAARVYDRIGRLQDTQAPFERPALDRLVRAGDFARARSVLEVGCGTGSLARRLLAQELPRGSTYTGLDVSTRMVALSRRRVAPWAERARILQVDGSLPLPAADSSADRIIAAYVLDLLDPAYAGRLIEEATRILTPGGRLCLVSLTQGKSRRGRALTRAWRWIWERAPQLVGGCRPIQLARLLEQANWNVVVDAVIESWSVPSEILVAAAQ